MCNALNYSTCRLGRTFCAHSFRLIFHNRFNKSILYWGRFSAFVGIVTTILEIKIVYCPRGLSYLRCYILTVFKVSMNFIFFLDRTNVLLALVCICFIIISESPPLSHILLWFWWELSDGSVNWPWISHLPQYSVLAHNTGCCWRVAVPKNSLWRLNIISSKQLITRYNRLGTQWLSLHDLIIY